jgi:hypothetical protein
MRKAGIAIVALLLGAAFAIRAEQVFYQIDLVPSGRLIALDMPVAKGSTIVFHRYPDGLLMSMRRSDVKAVGRISPQAAVATLPQEKVVQIGDLAFQGAAQAGLSNTSAVRAKSAPAIGRGFYSEVVPGVTQGMPNSRNDNVIGRSWAPPPSNATQSAPGSPPTNPGATAGMNPPQ